VVDRRRGPGSFSSPESPAGVRSARGGRSLRFVRAAASDVDEDGVEEVGVACGADLEDLARRAGASEPAAALRLERERLRAGATSSEAARSGVSQ
jgi:hypothetical protein